MTQGLSANEVLELDRRFENAGDGRAWRASKSWPEILESRFVVVLGEGGMGKTTELRAQAAKLRREGGSAFFLELTELAANGLELAIDPRDEANLRRWRGTAQPAVFLLDSLDEAKLQSQSLRRALAQLRRALGNDWAHVRLVVSSRGSDWLPSVDLPELQSAIGADESPLLVDLAPLTRDQVELLAARHGVTDVAAFWRAIQESESYAFTTRPADAIWLASYWAKRGRLDSLTDLIENNIIERCQERPNHSSAADVPTLVRCRAGLRALAGISLLENCSSFLIPDCAIDFNRRIGAIDPRSVLPDWTLTEVQALLRLPIFDEGTYGRVRLHHRFVHEYLAAQWFEDLLDAGWRYQELEMVLFRSSAMGAVVPANLHAVAAWLAPHRDILASRLSETAPEILLHHGDPARLSEMSRLDTLGSLARRYNGRERLGHWFSPASLRRFACVAMSSRIAELVADPLQALEFRVTLVQLVEYGRLADCARTMLLLASDTAAPVALRKSAIRSIGAIGSDREQEQLLAVLEGASNDLVGEAMGVLYPTSINEECLVDFALRAQPADRDSSNTVVSRWLRLVENAKANEQLALLCALNVKLESKLEANEMNAICWASEMLSRSVVYLLPKHLGIHASLVPRQLESSLELLRRLGSEPSLHYHFQITDVSEALRHFPSLRQHLFWLGVLARWDADTGLDAWRSLPYRRELFHLCEDDCEWLAADAAGTRPMAEQLFAYHSLCGINLEHPSVSALAAGQPIFAEHLRLIRVDRARIDKELRVQELLEEQKAREQELKESYVLNASVLCENIEQIRAGLAQNLLTFLYEVSTQLNSGYGEVDVEPLRISYGQDVAEAAEQGLRAFWRRHMPELKHEREKPNEFSVLDIMGLAGVALDVRAGADVESWPDADVRRATCYATCEVNGLPFWLELLSASHPKLVHEVLEPAVRAEYFASSNFAEYVTLIPSVEHAGDSTRGVVVPIVAACMREGEATTPSVQESCLQLVAALPECEALALDVVEERCRRSVSRPEFFAVWMENWLQRDSVHAVDFLIGLAEVDDQPISSAAPSAEELPEYIAANTPFRSLMTTLMEHLSRWRYPDSYAQVPLSLRKTPQAIARLLPLLFNASSEPEKIRLTRSGGDPDAFRMRLLECALDLNEGLPVAEMLLLAEHPRLAGVRDHILMVAQRHAETGKQEVENPAVERLRVLYRQHGTSTLGVIGRSLASANVYTPVTVTSILGDLAKVGQSLIDKNLLLPREEDKISDWLLELLRHRLQDKGVDVNEQSRGGYSASLVPLSHISGRLGGIGERDAVLRCQGRTLGIFEAFRLSSVASQVIESHLNKLPGYNLIGAAAIYVAVYYQGSKFSDFVERYCLFVEKHRLANWLLRKEPRVYQIDDMGCGQKVLRFAYDTPRGEQVMFHVLLDLGG